MHTNPKLCQKLVTVVSLATLASWGMPATPAQARGHQLVTFDAPGSSSGALQGTAVWGINLEGTIVGDVTDNSGGTHGYVRSPDGTFSEFDVPGANPAPGYGCEYNLGGTCPVGINDFGWVAGWDEDAANVYHSFLRNPDGQIVTFDVPGAGTGANQGTLAQSINDWGVVVGYYWDSSNTAHGFVRLPNGTINTIDSPIAGNGTFALSINNLGAIAGFEIDSTGFSHGFLRRADGSFTVFTPPGSVGGPGTYGSLISDSGVIAGYYFDANLVGRGYQRKSDGAITDYDVPGSGAEAFEGAWVNALNVAGTAVGYVEDGNDLSHSWVRSRDGDFNVFEIPGQLQTAGNSYGSGAFAINAEGVVAGRWYDANYCIHGWMLIPR